MDYLRIILVVVMAIVCIGISECQSHKPVNLNNKIVLIKPQEVLKRIFYKEGVVVPKVNKSGVPDSQRVNTPIVEVKPVETHPKQIMVSRKGIERRINISPDDYQILLRIVEAECTGAGVEEKSNVAQVVLNRTKEQGVYPCTIRDVVFSPRQFSPISDLRYYKVDITESTIQAVNQTLMSPNRHECLYFKAKGYESRWFKTLKFEFKDKIHEFYNVKGE